AMSTISVARAPASLATPEISACAFVSDAFVSDMGPLGKSAILVVLATGSGTVRAFGKAFLNSFHWAALARQNPGIFSDARCVCEHPARGQLRRYPNREPGAIRRL